MAEWLGPAFGTYRPSEVNRSYTEHLQQLAYHKDLAARISEPIKQLITHTEQASIAQIQQLERVESAQAQASYEIISSIRDLQSATEDGFRRVGSILDWGFARVAILLGRTNDLLAEIKNFIENPSLTWAYEQFNRARDLFRRGHYKDALQWIGYAINGHANELGDRTEHRFHFLRGVLLLGDRTNNSEDVVDLAAAEEAFVLTSRYAAHDFPKEAAHAQLYAAYAANSQGKYDIAAAHAEKGLALHETAGLHYELARSSLQLGRQTEAAEHLKWSIRLDKNLLLIAPTDAAFRSSTTFLQETFQVLLSEARRLAKEAAALVANEKERISHASFTSRVFRQTYAVEAHNSGGVAATESLSKLLLARMSDGGIWEIRQALEEIPDLWKRLEKWNEGFAQEVSAFLDELLRERRQELNTQDISSAPSENLVPIVGFSTAAVAFLYGCLRLADTLNNPGAGGDVFEDLISAIGSPILLGFIAAGITHFFVSSAQDSAKRDRHAVRDSVEAITSAVAEEQRTLANLTFYSPSQAIFETIPAWALGSLAVSPAHPARVPPHAW